MPDRYSSATGILEPAFRPGGNMGEWTEEHQFVIIGGGPAGLQLSYFLQQAGADYVALEREDAPGGFFRRYPRHRRLISLNKVHTTSTDREIQLRWDWNSLLNEGDDELRFPDFSQEYFPHADDLVRYLEAFQERHSLAVRYGSPVTRVERLDDGTFLVRTGASTIRCQSVVSATGWGRPFVPAIRGIEHTVGYEDMSVDPNTYRGQRVLIIGKGNSAFETASGMLGHTAIMHVASRRPPKLAWNTKHPGDVRGQHGAVLDSYQFKTLHAVLECTIDEIRPVDGHYEVDITYTLAEDESATMVYDTVIRCTGFVMDTSIFDSSCSPEMTRDNRMPALRTNWESANVDGLFFAGTIAQDRDFKHASSPFVDGFRYNLRTLTALLCERYAGRELAGTAVPAKPQRLTELILDRLNWSSALWTQFEYLCDVLVVDEAGGEAAHYVDLPEDYAVERFADSAHYYTVTLRWGRDDHRDVFDIKRRPVPEHAAESAFIHPVIRRWRGTEMVSELHLLEDIHAEWRWPDRHVQPLEDFLTAQLGGG
jgi:thioredoxin reductase